MMIGMPILYEYNSIYENAKLAKELGLDFIELNLNFEYCRKEMENKTVEKLLKEMGLKATLHFYDEADFASYDEVNNAYFTLLKRYVKLGKNYLDKINLHLNIGPIVTISGVKNYLYEKEYSTYILKLKKNLDKISKFCNKYGIEIVLENVYTPPFIMRTYEDLIASGYKFNYDVGHDDNYYYNIKKISDKLNIKEMHIHDGNTKTCHLAIGDGNMDIKSFVKLAQKNDAYIVVEVKNSNDLQISIPKIKDML